ncbi:hypothetical protein BC829DRAFT_394251, partial [Chytridium lagenaria]
HEYIHRLHGRTFVDIGQEATLSILGALTVLAAIVRLYKIYYPSEVVFDEVHFGGFGSKYIRGEFFMGCASTGGLGKLLVAATGVLAGYNGSFSFKEIGLDYLEAKVPYVTMRLLPGIFGCLYYVKKSWVSNQASVLSSVFLLFGNQSRLILLDSSLLFFTGLTTMMWSDFLRVFLGLAVSVKWVGLFVIATVGISTIQNLWTILGDNKVPMIQFGRHFLARAVCLILLPFSIYAFLFQVHFWALPNSGSDFEGNEIGDTFRDIAYGSVIYLRHDATSGGYLHSHNSFYPSGSKQQQITLYPFRVIYENSKFLIKPPLDTSNGTTKDTTATSLKYIKNGDIIRLLHVSTKKHLHSHDVRPIVTDNEHNLEVSGYGEPGYPGDTNDHWRVEFSDSDAKGQQLEAIHTRFRLIHVNTWCQLFSHSVKLPEWVRLGFGQQEVICAKQGKRSHTIWLPKDAKHTNYKKVGFWGKFFELHAVMWRTNAGLKSSHPFDSRPVMWPFLRRGRKSGQIYLIGNPIVWWSSSLVIFVYLVVFGVKLLLAKRQVDLFLSPFLDKAFGSCFLLFSGWFFHYFPFFLMSRQLFLHHYFPALYFAILLIGGLFELLTIRYESRSRWILVGLLCFLAFWVFWDLSPLTYGSQMSRRRCERIKWGRHWDWSCLNSPDEIHVRKPMPAEVHHEEKHKKPELSETPDLNVTLSSAK